MANIRFHFYVFLLKWRMRGTYTTLCVAGRSIISSKLIYTRQSGFRKRHRSGVAARAGIGLQPLRTPVLQLQPESLFINRAKVHSRVIYTAIFLSSAEDPWVEKPRGNRGNRESKSQIKKGGGRMRQPTRTLIVVFFNPASARSYLFVLSSARLSDRMKKARVCLFFNPLVSIHF